MALGEGSYARVMKIDADGKSAAIKCYSVPPKSGLSSAYRELEFLNSLRHPNIIELLSVFTGTFSECEPKENEEDGGLHLVMERGETSLKDHLINSPIVSKNEIKRFATDILLALEYLQLNGVIHRDLSSSNVLIMKDGRYVLCDFGMSKYFISDAEMNDLYGHLYVRAPEMYAKLAYGYEVDIWSLGVLVQELILGNNPFAVHRAVKSFEGESILRIIYNIPLCPKKEAIIKWVGRCGVTDPRCIRACEQREKGSIVPGCSRIQDEEVLDFLQKCLAFYRHHRWNATQLLDHPWLNSEKDKIASARSKYLHRHVVIPTHVEVAIPPSKVRMMIRDYIQNDVKKSMPKMAPNRRVNRICLALNIFYRICNNRSYIITSDIERGYIFPLFIVSLAVSLKYYNTNSTIEFYRLVPSEWQNLVTPDYIRSRELDFIQVLDSSFYRETTYDILIKRNIRVSEDTEDQVWMWYLEGNTRRKDVEGTYEAMIDAQFGNGRINGRLSRSTQNESQESREDTLNPETSVEQEIPQ